MYPYCDTEKSTSIHMCSFKDPFQLASYIGGHANQDEYGITVCRMSSLHLTGNFFSQLRVQLLVGPYIVFLIIFVGVSLVNTYLINRTTIGWHLYAPPVSGTESWDASKSTQGNVLWVDKSWLVSWQSFNLNPKFCKDSWTERRQRVAFAAVAVVSLVIVLFQGEFNLIDLALSLTRSPHDAADLTYRLYLNRKALKKDSHSLVTTIRGLLFSLLGAIAVMWVIISIEYWPLERLCIDEFFSPALPWSFLGQANTLFPWISF